MNPALLAALGAGAMVVTPNRRLARFLHRQFDVAQRRRGVTVWPTPTILPYPQWLEWLWQEALAADAVDAALLLTPLQSTVQWRQIVDADADRVPLFDGRAAAALAAEAWSLVHQWGVGGESWRSWRVDGGDPDDPAVFARWAEAYATRLRAAGARDLALLPDALIACAGTWMRALPPTVIAGLVEPTPQHERLFHALREAGAALTSLDTLPEIEATAQRTVAPTVRDEIAAAFAWAREHARARPEARIGVVVENLAARRDEVLALAEELLAPEAAIAAGAARMPFELSLGPSLAAVPLVATALDLIALGEASLDAGAAAALLRSPYLPDAAGAWLMRARAEREWLDEGRSEVTLGDAVATLDRGSDPLAQRWRSARDVLRGLARFSPREWSDAWRAWLAGAGWPGTRTLDSGEYQARVAWEKLLVDFASLSAVAPRLSSARALATLQSLASEQRFQPEGGSAPIQILGVLEGAGLAFDALWVAGFASERWPAAPDPNPLLPLAWQRERNVAHATAEREREYARSLTVRFARAAPEVVFSCAAVIDDCDASPSALIRDYPERAPSPRPRSWIDDIARTATLERIADDRAPAIAPGSAVRGGSRLVALQSDCPFQAVTRCRLRVDPWPASSVGLTALEHGKMVHAALALFWQGAHDHATLVAFDGAALAARIAEAVDRALAELPASRWRALPALLREGEARRLERTLAVWLALERSRPPFVAQALEERMPLRLGGIDLTLRLDRVDALADGGVSIIDYKTGEVERPRQWFDERPRSVQLGLYALAHSVRASGGPVRAVAFAELRPEGVAAVGIAADEGVWPELDSAAVAPGGTWTSLEAWWARKLDALGAEIAGGHAAVAPRLTPSPCRNCGLQAVCRIESVRAIDLSGANDE
ncbi:MAG TPA: PD-(D/E)XK nuclease family protein [Casimicrobiaceae bacterium]|nr:PD-(D/E)XK nuclease family protein [Casimicrobiaceae bacterium]